MTLYFVLGANGHDNPSMLLLDVLSGGFMILKMISSVAL